MITTFECMLSDESKLDSSRTEDSQGEQASKEAGTAPVSAKEAAKTILFMLFLCVINLLIFFDRGAIAVCSNLIIFYN